MEAIRGPRCSHRIAGPSRLANIIWYTKRFNLWNHEPQVFAGCLPYLDLGVHLDDVVEVALKGRTMYFFAAAMTTKVSTDLVRVETHIISSLYSPSILHAISYHKLIHRYLWRTIGLTSQEVSVLAHCKFKSGDKKSLLRLIRLDIPRDSHKLLTSQLIPRIASITSGERRTGAKVI
ncbi:uncharacterized protein ARMOST_15988 [Armillaria ostoyae]|uniref:Uncharacterized protein n=1 Tax=Armillaria ostoyae TaxID=47428 RepID=A0A284RUZ4_ARMOS|nr:uncharacterized protein ARMOST_15988 [Armillaria ostoyae]